jgi:hypothetical protein
MTSQPLPPELQQLVDRQQIYDCIVRYCSGVDRFDRAMVRGVYHDDAMDDHGAFVGTADEFVDWAFAYHAKYQHHHKHFVLNHRCELDGNTAHTETYWMFSGKNKMGPPLTLSGGRYIDRFEKRNGKWAIAARKCVIEWNGVLDEAQMPQENLDAYALTGVPLRDRNDASYARPLQITRGKFVLPF